MRAHIPDMATRYETMSHRPRRAADATLGRSPATGLFVMKPAKKPGMSISVKDVRVAIERLRREGAES